jgi:hypothetical protein
MSELFWMFLGTAVYVGIILLLAACIGRGMDNGRE